MAVLIEVAEPSRGLRMVPRGAGRLLRIELRRNAMLWLLPLAAVLFWWQAYRSVLALPPLWSLRAMSLQNDALLDFAVPVTAAAAWMGGRERRRHIAEMLTSTARVRWARNLAAWAATTCWALAGYIVCVGVVYVITARQAVGAGRCGGRSSWGRSASRRWRPSGSRRARWRPAGSPRRWSPSPSSSRSGSASPRRPTVT